MSEQPRVGPFAGGENTPWPGAWRWGVDFAGVEEGDRVIAICTNSSDDKYGYGWIGPIPLTKDNMSLLEIWARSHLDLHGGYVHLLPAEGDASATLRERCDDIEDLDIWANRGREAYKKLTRPTR